MSLRDGNGVSSSQRDALVALNNVARVEVVRMELSRVIGFASNDIETAGKVASWGWFLDGVHGGERHALDALGDIASHDVELARLVTSSPWLQDGIISRENNVLRDLRSIVLTDLEVAGKMKSLPWLYDTITDDESDVILTLDQMTSADAQLARMASSLPWFVDGLDRNEKTAIAVLMNTARLDQELARLVIAAPWFEDGITFDEWRGLLHLKFTQSGIRRIEGKGPDLQNLARALPWLERGWDRDLYRYFFRSLGNQFQTHGADAVGQLVSQHWFADGLSEEEAALVVTLTSNDKESSLYRDLLKAHYVQSKTVSLPLAGDVNIWVIQPAPFPPNDNMLSTIQDTARIMEEFLDVPFPTTDIILLVADRRYPIEGFGVGGFHGGSHMRLIRYDGREVEVPSITHETAHYYMKGTIGPTWLVEGGAEFFEAYVNDLIGTQDLKDRRIEVSQKVQSLDIDRSGLENIRHCTYVGRHIRCPYRMGENLLHGLFETMGEEAMRAALRELYLLDLEQENRLVGAPDEEERVYLTFLKHTPPDRKEAFRDLYRRLHGGQFAFPEIDLSDDHGDEASAASEVQVGNVVEGTLDYMWDFDYFRFQAQEGQVYWINLTHETLRSSSISLYGSDGQTAQAWMLRDRDPTGPRMLWEAQDSGEYYFAVQNFGGKTGRYTFAIIPLITTADDHGDTPATPTEISVKGIVEGTIDHSADVDVFRIQAVEGRRYGVVFRLGTLEEGSLVRYDPRAESTFNSSKIKRPGETALSWPAWTSGDYYYIVAGHDGSVGTYTLVTSGGVDPSE